MESISTYQKVMTENLMNATPEKLMVMLYEGMITRIKQAQEQIKIGQKLRFKESLIKAMRIADALMENLNKEQGGETVENLEKLYAFMISEISQASLVKDPEASSLDPTLNILETLCTSWKKLAERSS